MTGELPRLEEVALQSGLPQWLVDMHDHYAETGTYRPEDLERVLGDQTKGVSMGAREVSEMLSRHTA